MKPGSALAVAAVLLFLGFAEGRKLALDSQPTTEATTELRAAILSVNVDYAAQIMTEEPSIQALAEGMKPPPGSPPFKPSPNRQNDPDVVLFKAIAKAILDSDMDPALIEKLARAAVLSIKPPGGYPEGVTEEQLLADMISSLSDYDTLVDIRDGDPNQEPSHHDPSQSAQPPLAG